jgi:putative membrane protein
MWGYDFGWGGMLLMLLGTLLFLALLAVLIWALARFVTGKTTTPVSPHTNIAPTAPSALEILRQRYARGEIDTATHEQMRTRLETPLTQPPAGRV